MPILTFSMDMKDYRIVTNDNHDIICHVSLSSLGNGMCGCSGNCTCNEGFSGGTSVNAGPLRSAGRKPVLEEVSSPCTFACMQCFMSP